MKPFMLILLFSAAFGYIEAAVVVYLRELYFPQGFAFPIPPELLGDLTPIELGREFCTLMVLFLLGGLAGRKRWLRFAFFIFAFGAWDIFYYIWLKVLIGWPESFYTWDLLFLIPVVWVGPVLSPMIVAASLCLGGLLIVWQDLQGFDFKPNFLHWILWIIAAGIIIWSYVIEYGDVPTNYEWKLLIIGEITGFITFFDALRRGW